jgi:hypothetical protein
MEIVDKVAKKVMTRIGDGYKSGGITALKNQFPEAYNSLEEDLTKDFSIDGLKKFETRLIKGLKKVGHWKQ